MILSAVKLLDNEKIAESSGISKAEFYRLFEELKGKIAEEKQMYQRIFEEKDEDIETEKLLSSKPADSEEEATQLHPSNSLINLLDCCKNLYLLCRSYLPSKSEK